jgi:hypothetical protein
MGTEDAYIVNGRSFPADIVNEFVIRRIKEFGERLSGVGMAKVAYITGGNLNDIYGARNMLCNACDRRILTACDELTKQSKYPEATINAMLRLILQH